MKTLCLWLPLVLFVSSTAAEDIFRESFEKPMPAPFSGTWGDEPTKVLSNAAEPKVGLNGSSAARLRLEFPAKTTNNLSYWSFAVSQPVPLVPEVKAISFHVKTNVPVSIKVAISPYGFIYHGPTVGPFADWQRVSIESAYEELKKWCEVGGQRPEGAMVAAVIVAIGGTQGATADVLIDDLAIEGPAGAAKAVADESFRRRTRKVRIAPVSLLWDQGHRTLAHVLEALDEAGQAGADLACLPEMCVDQPPESIPGPASQAIAGKAAQYKMHVVGNLREQDGPRRFVTSFLCDRQGRITGKYRKSHRLPYEAGSGPPAAFDLGDDLPVFATDIGPIGLRIGTDHYFAEIDTVLARRGARLIVWSTSPFPIRDEHTITLAIQGRAMQNGVYYAVARYAGESGYGGYEKSFSWTATWPLGRAQVFDSDGHTLADSGHAGGIAIATVPAARLVGGVGKGGYEGTGKFGLITAAALPPPRPIKPGAKRTVRAAAIECDGNIERLLAKLDFCGRRQCDIACLWEYVWYNNDEEVGKFKTRNSAWLARIAEAAARNKMYVVIAGELERGFNESILFDRQGREIGRYTKIVQTTPKTSRFYQAGEQVGIYDLDFGRICTKICADVYSHEIDRVAALHQVDIMLHHTQDAGPFTEHTRLREAHRCVDNGYFLVRAAAPTGQSDHRTYLMDPWGIALGQSQFHADNEPVVVALQLDNRPRYYEWPEDISKSGPYPDPYQRGVQPVAKGDLRAVLLGQRRPELYRSQRP